MKQELNRILKSDLTSYDSILQQKISNIDHINDCLTQRSRFINSFQQMLKKQMQKIITKEEISQQIHNPDDISAEINTSKQYQNILKQLLSHNAKTQKIQIPDKKHLSQKQTGIISKSYLMGNQKDQSFLDFFEDTQQKPILILEDRKVLSTIQNKQNNLIHNDLPMVEQKKCYKSTFQLRSKIIKSCMDSICLLRQQNIKLKQFFALQVDTLGQFICEIFTQVMNQIVNKITEIYQYKIETLNIEKNQLNGTIHKLIQQLQALKLVINETPRISTKSQRIQELTFKNNPKSSKRIEQQIELPLKQETQKSLSLSRFLKNLTVSDTNLSKIKSIKGIRSIKQIPSQQGIKNIKIKLQQKSQLNIDSITPINKTKYYNFLNSEDNRIKQSYQEPASLQFSRSHIKKLFISNENSKLEQCKNSNVKPPKNVVKQSERKPYIECIQNCEKETQKTNSESKWKQYVYDITGKKNQVRSVYQDSHKQVQKSKEIEPKIPFLLKIANGKSYDIPNIQPFKNYIPPLKAGYNVLKVADKIVYKGMWQNNMFHGRGKLSLKQYTYEGQFKQGKFDGNGSLTIGEVLIQGTFKNNKLHGEATLKLCNKIIVGQWFENKFIRQY